MEDKPRMFSLYYDKGKTAFFAMPSDQVDTYLKMMAELDIEVVYLIEDDDPEFLNAVGPILI